MNWRGRHEILGQLRRRQGVARDVAKRREEGACASLRQPGRYLVRTEDGAGMDISPFMSSISDGISDTDDPEKRGPAIVKLRFDVPEN